MFIYCHSFIVITKFRQPFAPFPIVPVEVIYSVDTCWHMPITASATSG